MTKHFPRLKSDIRHQFFDYWNDIIEIEQTRISDLGEPFEKQPKHAKDNGRGMRSLCKGFVLQRLFEELISDAEKRLDHLHIIFTDLLICTFSEDDWRFHGRAVISGTLSIISIIGVVEAPAKPREFLYCPIQGI